MTLSLSHDKFGSLSWLPNVLKSVSTLFEHLKDGTGEASEYTHLKAESAKFDFETRKAFSANPRFLDQYFDPSDFAYDVELAEGVVTCLDEAIGGDICKCFENFIAQPLDTIAASSSGTESIIAVMESFNSVVRGLRNLATQAAMRRKVPAAIWFPVLFNAPLSLIHRLPTLPTALKSALVPSLTVLARSILQMATNMGIQNSSSNAVTWHLVIPNWSVCVNISNDPGLLAAMCAFINNSCMIDEMRICDILFNSTCCRELISRYISLRDSEPSQLNVDTEHWFHLVLNRMRPHLPILMKALSAGDAVSTLQLHTLHMIESDIEIWVKEHPNTPISLCFGETTTIPVTSFLVSEALRFEPLLVSIARNCAHAPMNPIPADSKLDVEYSWLCLQLLASMSTALDAAEKSVEASLAVVRSIIRLLGNGLSPPPPASSATGSARMSLPEDTSYLGLKTLLVRILANYSFGCRAVQDEIRVSEGIPLVLNGCNDDPYNPYVREWSLFACRNICDRNEENQNVIANIKVSGVMPSVELEQMGFRAVLENTGKVRVEKVEEGDADHTLLAQKPEEQ